MLNTPPPPPPQERDTATLVEDLCIALREVGVQDWGLPEGERVVQAIGQVRAFHQELTRRGVDVTPRLRELTTQTRWRMEDLLADCLAYPQTMPYVRDLDGVRRSLRCTLCAKAERPADDAMYSLCDGCLWRAVTAVEAREPIPGVVLFRTYNVESRCKHADDETVLAQFGWGDTFFGYCGRCLGEELVRRRTGGQQRQAAPRGN